MASIWTDPYSMLSAACSYLSWVNPETHAASEPIEPIDTWHVVTQTPPTDLAEPSKAARKAPATPAGSIGEAAEKFRPLHTKEQLAAGINLFEDILEDPCENDQARVHACLELVAKYLARPSENVIPLYPSQFGAAVDKSLRHLTNSERLAIKQQFHNTCTWMTEKMTWAQDAASHFWSLFDDPRDLATEIKTARVWTNCYFKEIARFRKLEKGTSDKKLELLHTMTKTAFRALLRKLAPEDTDRTKHYLLDLCIKMGSSLYAHQDPSSSEKTALFVNFHRTYIVLRSPPDKPHEYYFKRLMQS